MLILLIVAAVLASAWTGFLLLANAMSNVISPRPFSGTGTIVAAWVFVALIAFAAVGPAILWAVGETMEHFTCG